MTDSAPKILVVGYVSPLRSGGPHATLLMVGQRVATGRAPRSPNRVRLCRVVAARLFVTLVAARLDRTTLP